MTSEFVHQGLYSQGPEDLISYTASRLQTGPLHVLFLLPRKPFFPLVCLVNPAGSIKPGSNGFFSLGNLPTEA